ncbi:metabotropic glutamate receptor 2-like [Tropilaelaps mercedesae]|uniref:Metabotropic glutamate receptor 2-like n=1 Tax=Tropilaelaps mercedesae TaxID=418985 RepID=A0A1V9XBE2_9ACAR|nr:metabotropic glutamate receptor 2-like [Tropilaelaps mercedesae]
MYTTCIIWLSFVPLYLTVSGPGSSQLAIGVTVMCVSISLSASVTLVCMFAPKLYIILLHPEKNVRQPVGMVQQRCGAVLKSMQRRHVECATQSDDVELLGGAGHLAGGIGYGVFAAGQLHGAGQQIDANLGAAKAAASLTSSCAATQTPDWWNSLTRNDSIRSNSGGTSPNNNRSFRHSHEHSGQVAVSAGANDSVGSFRRHQQQPQHRGGSATELSNSDSSPACLTKRASGEVVMSVADEAHPEPKETDRLCSVSATAGLWDRHNGGQVISSSARDVQL